MKNRIFIIGPREGIADENIISFEAAKGKLSRLGYKVQVPHDLFTSIDTAGFNKQDYIRHEVSAMVLFDRVVTLQGWENCKVACILVGIARTLLLPMDPIIIIEPFLKGLPDQRL